MRPHHSEPERCHDYAELVPEVGGLVLARRNITISELTREAIEHHLGPRRRLGAAAAGRSGSSDISERIEEILASEVPASR